jgi:hypothetical protein
MAIPSTRAADRFEDLNTDRGQTKISSHPSTGIGGNRRPCGCSRLDRRESYCSPEPASGLLEAPVTCSSLPGRLICSASLAASPTSRAASTSGE